MLSLKTLSFEFYEKSKTKQHKTKQQQKTYKRKVGTLLVYMMHLNQLLIDAEKKMNAQISQLQQ
jgi:hypothetical protein